jgi:hypothetical protein
MSIIYIYTILFQFYTEQPSKANFYAYKCSTSMLFEAIFLVIPVECCNFVRNYEKTKFQYNLTSLEIVYN